MIRPQGAGAGGPAPSLAPTSGAAPLPHRRPRRTGLNPWYFVFIGGLPILIITIMLLTVGGVWPPPGMASRVRTPTPVWGAYAAFLGKDQFDKITVDQGTADPDPSAGPGWYVIHAKLTNGSGFDMENVDLRAFLYDKDGGLVGSGIGNIGAIKNGETKALDVQAQLSNGPIPRSLDTPTPAMPAAFDHYKVSVVAILPAPTPVK